MNLHTWGWSTPTRSDGQCFPISPSTRFQKMWTSGIWTLCELEHPHFQWLIMASISHCKSYPLRRPTQSSAKLVFVTSGAVEIHGFLHGGSQRGQRIDPLPSMMTGGQFTFLWWVSSCFHYHYCYYDSMPTIRNYTMIWYDLFRANGGMVGWCGVDECHTSPSSALGRKRRISGGVGSRKATTFTRPGND